MLTAGFCPAPVGLCSSGEFPVHQKTLPCSAPCGRPGAAGLPVHYASLCPPETQTAGRSPPSLPYFLPLYVEINAMLLFSSSLGSMDEKHCVITEVQLLWCRLQNEKKTDIRLAKYSVLDGVLGIGLPLSKLKLKRTALLCIFYPNWSGLRLHKVFLNQWKHMKKGWGREEKNN